MVWKDATSDISEEDIKKHILEYAHFLKELKIKKYLGDERQRNFNYDIDLQKWVSMQAVEACSESGMQKYALVISTDIINQLSTEQTVEEGGKLPFELKYFDTEEEALKWLGV